MFHTRHLTDGPPLFYRLASVDAHARRDAARDGIGAGGGVNSGGDRCGVSGNKAGGSRSWRQEAINDGRCDGRQRRPDGIDVAQTSQKNSFVGTNVMGHLVVNR